MPVAENISHFTVRWTCSWSNSWRLLHFLKWRGDKCIYHVHQRQSLFHFLKDSLSMLPFASLSYIYTQLTWGPPMIWSLHIIFLLARTRERKLHRVNSHRLFLPPCPVTSSHITSADNAHPLLWLYFQGEMSPPSGTERLLSGLPRAFSSSGWTASNHKNPEKDAQ